MTRRSMLIAAVVVGVAGGVVVGTSAFGGTDTDVITAAEYYATSMSPEEVSAASVGKEGEPLPPCPAVEVVESLKGAGLPVGPCVPVPVPGRPITLPDIPEGEADRKDEGPICTVVSLLTDVPGAPNEVRLPCNEGAAVVDVGELDSNGGKSCVPVTFIASAGEKARTEVVCVGDPVDLDLPSLVRTVN